ncbi:pyrimidine/purine nucleoside phosphorylase [Azotosporobacter soli]|uniref:pyrimidine/purine nucleoside phosphorylase n=1 Tax=Azotosporobacter soli TaxID=3055040 RepID=UPI0031FED5BA
MLKVNEYFERQVISIGFADQVGPATVGVMVPGAYTFNTSQLETMLVVSGSLEVKLPGETSFQTYAAGSSFKVPAGAAFDVKATEPTSYLCRYE